MRLKPPRHRPSRPCAFSPVLKEALVLKQAQTRPRAHAHARVRSHFLRQHPALAASARAAPLVPESAKTLAAHRPLAVFARLPRLLSRQSSPALHNRQSQSTTSARF
eukprot:1512778-Pleurochrysis_carterae.AAC.1